MKQHFPCSYIAHLLFWYKHSRFHRIIKLFYHYPRGLWVGVLVTEWLYYHHNTDVLKVISKIGIIKFQWKKKKKPAACLLNAYNNWWVHVENLNIFVYEEFTFALKRYYMLPILRLPTAAAVMHFRPKVCYCPSPQEFLVFVRFSTIPIHYSL